MLADPAWPTSSTDAYSRPASSSFWDLEIADPGYAHLFDGPIYYRGAMALYALRLKIGKADFDKVLRRWAAKYANGNATTADLRQLSRTHIRRVSRRPVRRVARSEWKARRPTLTIAVRERWPGL